MNELESKWKIYRVGGKFRVHRLTPGGKKGEPIGDPHDTYEEAERHVRALYANEPDLQASNLMMGAVHFEADELNPRILRFKNVVLARPETNKNLDRVDEQGIRELAETIPGMPLDVDHDVTKNIGIFTAGRVGAQGELRVDGYVWLDRCQAMGVDPNSVLSGQYGLSIEADAETAECSICHRVHSNAREYCSHIASLRAKIAHGASRMLRGLRAIGGALARNPAGSATGWDAASGIVFVASHQEADMSSETDLSASGALEKREDVSEADKKRAVEEYGDVEYADEQNKKYPLDEKHIRSAISYFSMPKNRAKYSPEDQEKIWSRIKRAAQKFGVEISEDKNKEEATMEDEEKVVADPAKGEDAVTPEPEEEEGDEMKAEYEAMKASLADMTAKFDELTAQKAALESELQAAKSQLTEVQAALRARRVAELRARFEASMGEDKFSKNLDWLLTLDEEKLALVAAPDKTPETGTRLKIAASEQMPEPVKWTLF